MVYKVFAIVFDPLCGLQFPLGKLDFVHPTKRTCRTSQNLLVYDTFIWIFYEMLTEWLRNDKVCKGFATAFCVDRTMKFYQWF